MAYYLIQAAYTSEAVAKLVRRPQDRLGAIRPMFKKLGGSLEGAWFAFGDYDIVLIAEMPNNVSAAAVSLAVGAGGVVRAIKTTPLMTAREGVAAMRKASATGYKPPKG
jgi:uncharacterized protein with GYD domain